MAARALLLWELAQAGWAGWVGGPPGAGRAQWVECAPGVGTGSALEADTEGDIDFGSGRGSEEMGKVGI